MMIELTEKQLQSWKKVFAKDGVVYDTDDEYREAVSNLVGYFDTLIQIDQSLRSNEGTPTTE